MFTGIPQEKPLVGILHLGSLSESLSYRAYLQNIGSESLLEWWVDRLKAFPFLTNTFIISGTPNENARLAVHLSGREVTLLTPPSLSQLSCAEQVSRLGLAPAVAWLPIEFCLAPRDLLHRVHKHHLEMDNTFTFVDGLPRGVSPAVYASDLILSIGNLHLSGLPDQLEVIVRRLKGLAETTEVELPLLLKSVPFDAGAQYGYDPTTVSRIVRVEKPNDVAILRRVRERLANTSHEPGVLALQIWKEEETKDASNRRRNLRTLVGAKADKCPQHIKPRILYVSNCSAFSGAEQELVDLVGAIDPERFETFALVAEEGLLADRLRESGAKVICPQDSFAEEAVGSFIYVYSILSDLKPDLVHLNGLDGIPMLLGASLLNIPIVQHVRVDPPDSYGPNLEYAHAVVAISDFVRRRLLQFAIPQKRVCVVYSGPNIDHFRQEIFEKHKVRKELGIPLDARVVLMIARFTAQKRHGMVLEAAARTMPTVPGFHLVFVGEHFGEVSYFDSIRTKALSLGLGDCTSWIPFLSDIRVAHAAADLLVLPSHREAFGRCVVEAMAMELPVVVTDSGGPQEAVAGRGFVVRSGDVDGLATAMKQALTNEDLSRSYANSARQFLEQSCNSVLSEIGRASCRERVFVGV